MHVSILALVATASSVMAGCFSGGENFATQKAIALSSAQDVCNSKYSQKDWSDNNPLAACYDLDSGKKVDFVLQRISTGGTRYISPAECYDGFQKEVNGCEYGGSTSYTNWQYTADVNAGSCA
ncbi:hypothetical protein SLS62_010989 [Diatrype stigma]|uniref:Glycan binding protein Y3-like domain-containing protein n=1 Tax=Diatrype stigma TaxID=117547 RepID=A0AAN9YGE5_9PEZI